MTPKNRRKRAGKSQNYFVASYFCLPESGFFSFCNFDTKFEEKGPLEAHGWLMGSKRRDPRRCPGRAERTIQQKEIQRRGSSGTPFLLMHFNLVAVFEIFTVAHAKHVGADHQPSHSLKRIARFMYHSQYSAYKYL